MAAARIERIITGLDVGSSKIAALIAGETADGSLLTLGTGVREAQGVKFGCVVDIAAVDRCVREALEQAERIAGVEVQDVWVGFGGGQLESRVFSHEEQCGGGTIDASDVSDLLARARDRALDDRRAALHAEPALYTLDGNQGVADPVGLHADRLAVDVHIVEGDRGPVANLATAVRAAHVNIRDVVATSMASGLSCLSDENRDLGTAVVDIGASLTNIALFAGGKLIGMATLPAGGNDITDDIASAFDCRRSQAERIKCFYGSAVSSPRDHQDQITIGDPDDAEETVRAKIPRAQLNAVIRKRLDHLLPDIARLLKSMGYAEPIARQVVLVGGGAELKGLADHVQLVLGGTARVGRPMGIQSLPDPHSGPQFAVAAGLVRYAASSPLDLRRLQRSVEPTGEARYWWQKLGAIWQRSA
jgi:cell division protein FtsA